MNKNEIFMERKEALGLVPGFFKEIPEDSLAMEWNLFKRYVLKKDSEIPSKYRELIGLGVAAANQCWYCVNFHTGLAKLHGATDAEIQEAVHLSKFGTGWSVYLNGTLFDKDQFMKELQEIGKYLSKE
ncbi:carboxymuconolactone decarboxylase family protein [Psychrilyobacter sp.]|uniref:carboxymuconolactone decarboxylase family protein n=1 Tax=Psychrilyobacter sp. TaxID=2586924 RepID=UPI0030174DC7